MINDYYKAVDYFFLRYGYTPTRIWVEQEDYDSILDFMSAAISPGYQLFLYGIPVDPR